VSRRRKAIQLLAAANVRGFVKSLAGNWKNIIWWRNELLPLVIAVLYLRNNGAYVLAEPWNNLIILDACRYDVFQEAVASEKTKGKLEYRISRGSDTESFMIYNFDHGVGKDVVYISANPHSEILKGRVHKVVSVWQTDWDEEYQTVLPEALCRRAHQASKDYPNNRLIVHFIQPHFPYIGYKHLNISKVDGNTILTSLANEGKNAEDRPSPKSDTFLTYSALKVYAAARLSTGEHFKAYKENLRRAMTCVAKLVTELPGRTIITADHGEAFGEYIHPLIPIRAYGHFHNMRNEVLTKVPWLIVDGPKKVEHLMRSDMNSSSNFKNKKEENDTFSSADEEMLRKRLKELGYD